MNVLLLGAATDATKRFADALGEVAAAIYRVEDSAQALRTLAQKQPQIAMVQIGAPGWDTFLQKVRDDYVGARPRLIGVASPDGLTACRSEHGLDAVLMVPASQRALEAAVSPSEVTLDVSRVRNMLRIGAIGRDLQQSLSGISRRLALVFSADECRVLAVADERQWIGSAGPSPTAEEWPVLWRECASAVNIGSPILSERGTQWAIPMAESGGTIVGAIYLTHGRAVMYDAGAVFAVGELATRLGSELYWWSVYKHVSAERDRLRESAILDPMLGILSRAALEPALETEIGRCARTEDPLTAAVIDVSGLRLINDRYGHLVGDAVLKQIADITRLTVRAQDVVGRYGGDEIALVMSATALPGAAKLLDRVCGAIETEPLEAGTATIALNVTAGISEYKSSDEAPGDVLVRAAQAAAKARERGGRIILADHAPPRADTRPSVELGPADRFEAGAILGGTYRIVHEISRGGMGVVYRAEDVGLGRPVALKMIRPDLALDTGLVQRFRAEASVLASLNHDNLVKVYALSEEDGDLFFVMELVEGMSLTEVVQDFVDQRQWIPKARVVPIINQVASALEAMHAANLIHRDVKPDNVVLERGSGRAVLVDFGLAERLGTSGERGGTPGFIAPETFTGESENRCTDVYGLAATAYTLLLQRAPFGRSDNDREILRRQLHKPPAAPSSIRSELSSNVDSLFFRALAVHPDDRYETASQFANMLQLAVQDPNLDSTGKWRAFGREGSELSPGPAPSPLPTPQGRPVSRRASSQMELDSVPGIESPVDMSRGVLFRCAARALGREAVTGWRTELGRSNRPLASALSVQTRPLSWLPTDLLAALFETAKLKDVNASALAHKVAMLAVAQTFRTFFPTDPNSIEPKRAMLAIDNLWSRYHTFGSMNADQVDDESATLSLDCERTEPELCAFVQGLLERIVGLAGGNLPKVLHPTCNRAEAGICRFDVIWRAKSIVMG